jgi:hypothetical protein
MNRFTLAVLSTSLLAFGGPSVASAHRSRHHAACVARAHRHHARCARARVLSFGHALSSPAPTAPSGGPANPATETAGTVKSFLAPVLTIMLNDKTEVSGKVNERTEIECESATATGAGGDDEGESEDGGLSGESDRATAIAADTHQSGDDQGDDDQGDDGGNTENCGAEALKEGATVRAAELVLGGEGAVWRKLILVV